jgi:flagellin
MLLKLLNAMLGPVNSTCGLQSLLARNLREQDGILHRLATGRRINSGRDDPAGLISATQLEAAITALEAESRMLDRTCGRANVADGHVGQLSDMMSELRGLTVASANTAALSDDELAANQVEVDRLVANIQRFGQEAIASLDRLGLPADAREELAEQLRSAINGVSTLATGGGNDLRSGNFEAIQSVIQDGTAALAEARGTIGAHQKYMLESRQNALAVERENLLAAHSRIVDADYAEETSNLAQSQVRVAANIEVLRIARHNAGLVLRLLA